MVRASTDEGWVCVNINFIFLGCQALALIGWLALVAAPLNRAYCVGLARGVALVLAAAYLAQLGFNTVPVEGGSFTSLNGITALFSAPANVMLGWTHYLVFDLFVGSWIAEDSAREGIPHYAILPILVATLVIGPVGFLIYYGVRALHRARVAAPQTQQPETIQPI
jgi:Domain of unknown function (DUF4281)